ncbi:MAG: COG4223 family protein [Hyphomicrobiaceae bacterium]
MTDKNDGPGQKDGPAKAGERASGDGGAKRPHATLDLKAVEVPAGPGKPGSAPPNAAPSTNPKAPEAAVAKGQSEAARKIAAAAGDQRASARAAGGASAVPPEGPGGEARSSSATAAAAKPAAAPAPASASGGFASYLLAGVVGAVLALLAAPLVGPSLRQTFEQMGIAPQAPIDPAVAQRLAVLEKTIAAPAAKPTAEADVVRAVSAAAENGKQIAALKQQLAVAADQQSGTARSLADLQARLAKEPPIADAGARLQAMEQRLGEIAAAAASEPDRAGRIPQLALLTGRIAELEAALAARVGDLRKDVDAGVEKRLAPVAEASEAARSAAQRLDREVGALKDETNRLASGLDQVKNSTERLQLSLKAAQDETAKVASSVDEVRRDLDGRLKAMAKPSDVSAAVAPLATQLSSLERNLTSVVKSEGERNATAERIVLSLELGNLKRAMERGLPYGRELAEVAKVSGSRINLAPLEPYRNQGVPTLAELTRSFRPVAHAILDAEAEKADGTVMERLLSGAKSFVRVRKTTHARDDKSPEAVVARIEDALDAGRLADVLTETKSLDRQPDVAKAWIAKVEARQTVDAALKSIDDALKASLGAGPADQAAPAAQKKGRS